MVNNSLLGLAIVYYSLLQFTVECCSLLWLAVVYSSLLWFAMQVALVGLC